MMSKRLEVAREEGRREPPADVVIISEVRYHGLPGDARKQRADEREHHGQRQGRRQARLSAPPK